MPNDEKARVVWLYWKAFHQASDSVTVRPLAFNGSSYVPLESDGAGNLKVSGGGGGGGTEYTEDAAHAPPQDGPYVLGLRRDADTSPVDATGDMHPLVFDDQGNLKVNVKLGGGGSVTQYAEDVGLGATPTGTLGMARRKDTLGTLTPIEDDAVSLRTNSRGAQWVIHDGAATVVQPTPADLQGRVERIDGTAIASETTLSSVFTELGDKLDQQEFIDRVGDAVASPASNTVLDRLKTIAGNQTSGHPVTVSGSVAVTALTSAAASAKMDVGLWLGSSAPTVGQKTIANSIPVVLPSNTTSLNWQSVRLTDNTNFYKAATGVLPTSLGPLPRLTSLSICSSSETQGTTATVTEGIDVGNTSVTILASNGSRRRAWIRNTSSEFVYLSYTAAATVLSPIVLVPRVGQHEIVSHDQFLFKGAITAIAPTAGPHKVSVVELSFT